jgi:hypothetical protein
MAALPQAPLTTGPTRSFSPPDLRHQVVIVGDGSAGISVAARLHRRWREMDIAVIEPSEQHYYQPLWTLVGAGEVAKERTVFPMGGAHRYAGDYPNTCQHSSQLEDRRQQADEVRRHTGCTAAPEARELAHTISDIETSR